MKYIITIFIVTWIAYFTYMNYAHYKNQCALNNNLETIAINILSRQAKNDSTIHALEADSRRAWMICRNILDDMQALSITLQERSK